MMTNLLIESSSAHHADIRPSPLCGRWNLFFRSRFSAPRVHHGFLLARPAVRGSCLKRRVSVQRRVQYGDLLWKFPTLTPKISPPIRGASIFGLKSCASYFVFIPPLSPPVCVLSLPDKDHAVREGFPSPPLVFLSAMAYLTSAQHTDANNHHHRRRSANARESRTPATLLIFLSNRPPRSQLSRLP